MADFNPLAALLQGQQARTSFDRNAQEQQRIQLQNQLAQQGGGAFNPINQQLAGLSADPVASFARLNSARQGALIDDAKQAARMIRAKQPEQALALAQNRLNDLQQLDPNADTSDTVFAIQGIQQGMQTGDFSPILKALDNVSGIDLKKLDQPIKIQSSKIFDNGVVLGVKKGGGRQVIDSFGNIVSGVEARDVIRQAKDDERAGRQKIENMKRETTLLNARSKKIVEAEGVAITEGLQAAKGLPVLNRIDKLLELQSTGKPEQFKLWAKKQFGVSSANEIELENLLSQKVLQQIKPLFGAAPSAKEGEWLRDIEATYGTSTEGNKVLIQRGIALANERVRQGVDAARSRGDSRTVRNLEDWQNFKLDKFQPSIQNNGASGLTPEEQAELEALELEIGGQ